MKIKWIGISKSRSMMISMPNIMTGWDQIEPADDYNGEFEHSEEYPDINGMESSLNASEEEDNKNQDSSASSAGSSAASAASTAASSIAGSFVMMAAGAVMISSSYINTMAMETSYGWDPDTGAFFADSPDGREALAGEVTFVDEGDPCTEVWFRTYTVSYEDENGEIVHVETYSEEMAPLGHSFVLENSEGEDSAGNVSQLYVCERCGRKLMIDASVEGRMVEDRDGDAETDARASSIEDNVADGQEGE